MENLQSVVIVTMIKSAADSCWSSIPIGSVTSLDFGGELLKADNVFSNFLVITHFEPSKLIFSISFDVEGTEVGPEFGDEFFVIVGPSGVGLRVHE